MRNPLRLFTQHPATVGETYGEHLRVALGFALVMQAGALACAVHALLPFLCKTSGSRRIALLHDRMNVNRSAAGRTVDPAAAPARRGLTSPRV